MTGARVRSFVRDRDLAFGYALVLVVLAVVVFTQPAGESSRLVLAASSNLANLRTQPLVALLLSAFVVSSPWGLWLLPFVVWAYASAQRWLGRTSTLLVAAFGHVFATVLVALLLSAGITHQVLSRSLAREPDVGVSYGLAAVGGLLLFRLAPGRRWRMGAFVTLALTAIMAGSRTFTDLGHLIGWGIGVSIGFVGVRLAAAGDAPQ